MCGLVLVVVITSDGLSSPPAGMMKWESEFIVIWYRMPSCANTQQKLLNSVAVKNNLQSDILHKRVQNKREHNPRLTDFVFTRAQREQAVNTTNLTYDHLLSWLTWTQTIVYRS